LDVARGIRDESFNSFQANYPTNTYCLGENDVLGGNCSDIDGIYQRRVYINHNGLDPTGTRRCVVNPESSFVRSTVSWTDSDCRNDIKCHSVQLDLCLSNLNSVPPL
jgi:hypothetical protein